MAPAAGRCSRSRSSDFGRIAAGDISGNARRLEVARESQQTLFPPHFPRESHRNPPLIGHWQPLAAMERRALCVTTLRPRLSAQDFQLLITDAVNCAGISMRTPGQVVLRGWLTAGIGGPTGKGLVLEVHSRRERSGCGACVAALWIERQSLTLGLSEIPAKPGFPPFLGAEKNLPQRSVYRLTRPRHPPIYPVRAARGANDLAGGVASLA